MQLTTLLPLLAVLAAPALASNSPLERRMSGGSGHNKVLAREETAALHARAAERIAESVSKRGPVALAEKPRKKKRDGAQGCRVRGASFTPSASSAAATQAPSSTAQASSTTPAPSSTAAPADANNNVAVSASVGVSVGGSSSSGGGSSSNGGSNQGGLTPNGNKAGLSGEDMISIFGDKISWIWNYQATRYTDTPTSAVFVPTLWGAGTIDGTDASRMSAFKAINDNPQYVQGFYEPDCSPPMSSSIDPNTAAGIWNSDIAWRRSQGAKLISPGMCKQANEDWLQPFLSAIGQGNEWDITSIHINKNSIDGVNQDIDHYWNTYGKPIWVTEFACVDDQNGFTPSEDQGQINDFINQVVDLFEGDSRIYAYSMSEGEGLGNTWPPFQNGQLTESGQTYYNAVSKYH